MRDFFVKIISYRKVFDLILKIIVSVIIIAGIAGTLVFFDVVGNIGRKIGVLEDRILISGTGSMYPTFPKGKGITPQERSKEIVATVGMSEYPMGFKIVENTIFGYTIKRGDIVDFTNEKVENLTKKLYGDSAGFVKRVIAVEGDTIEIKDGLVYLNEKILNEPYIAHARSTFGGEFLPECKKMVIPKGKLFVMGDNRKGSGDSRHEIGFVDIKDINHVIALKKQKNILDKNWRNTKNDLLQSSKIRIDKNRYLFLLNEKRKKIGVPPLRYEPQLETSSTNRASVILANNDFSFEATRSGITMEKAMRDAGYSNIVWGEMPDHGYYEADELIESYFESSNMKDFLLNKDYQDFGLSAVEGTLNGCPAQVIVQHVGGYIPPNYSTSLVEGWKAALAQLSTIKPGWQKLTEFGEFYTRNKQEVDRINEIISLRISRIEIIVKKMEGNIWLTDEETRWTKQDEELSKEQNNLAGQLNASE